MDQRCLNFVTPETLRYPRFAGGRRVSEAHPIFKLCAEIQADLTRANARMTALRAHLADAGLEPVVLPVCMVCGPLHLPPATTLADHMHTMHDDESEAA